MVKNMKESNLPYMIPCEHAIPQADSQLHGICIFCYRDRLSAAHRELQIFKEGARDIAEGMSPDQLKEWRAFQEEIERANEEGY